MRGFLKRKIFLYLFFAVWALPLFSNAGTLRIKEISKIMDRFFNYHVESRELTPLIVKRSIKLYIEYFDAEKIYLLDSEVIPYLEMSDKRASEIYERVKKGDFKDFVELNGVIQNAIVRAQKLRIEAAPRIDLNGGDYGVSSTAFYAKSDSELLERQKKRMTRFFLFHQARSKIDTSERFEKLFLLFEKRVRRLEYSYLFSNLDGSAYPEGKIEHLFSLRILKAFAKSLDTHSSFFSPEEAYEMRLSLEKQFEGVGVVLTEGVDGVMISELIPGSPAAKSGEIEVNDLLVEIDGQSVEELSFDEVLDLLKKRDKGSITLGFRKEAKEGQRAPFRVALKKEPIVMQEERIQTSYEKFGDGIIGKIALFSFYESSDGCSSEKDIKEAIRKFREKGELVGLILDLRENSGGFLSQAVKVAGLFVSNGVIVISKYNKGETHYLRNVAGKSFYNGPLVVLTSKMSASASEIVAQALQDYGVAVIAGDERTFGKGSIQYQTVTDEKADMFFKVTVGRYYTVSGRSTQIDGVIADVLVPTQYAPYNIGEKFLEYPLSADRVEPAYLDSLSDLDEKTKRLFQLRYLPFLQRRVTFWQKALPILKKNSAYRIAHDADYQAFLKRQEKVRARQTHYSVNTIDEPIQIGMEDLQMQEGVNIVKDMILIEAEAIQQPAAYLEPTGSDS